MNRRIFGGSRVNRDRREASFARAVIAEATRRHNQSRETLMKITEKSQEQPKHGS